MANVKDPQFGAKGDGVTDDSTALQLAFNSPIKSVYLPDGNYFVPAGKILTIISSKYVWGPGKIIGPPVANMGGPACVIKIHGTLGASVSYGSVINKGQKTINVTNTFLKDDLLMISNFPTDATDAFTAGTSDMIGNTTRNYANLSTSNLRQTRRKELAVVAGANSGQIGLRSGTLNAYNSTVALKFEKVNSVDNVVFDGVTFQNIWIDAKYCRDFAFYKCRALTCLVTIQTSININCDFIDFDGQDTACRLNIFESSRLARITGIYRGTHTPSDNGVIATNQTSDLLIDVIVEGVDGTYGHGVHIDNNFGENWTGYTDVPSNNINVNAVGRGMNGSTVIVTSDPYSSVIDNLVINVASADSSLQLTGVSGAIINAAMVGQTINLYGVSNLDIQGKHGLVFQGNYTNPRNNAQVTPCTGVKFNAAGTYNPTIVGSPTPGTTTYTIQKGDYVRTGRQVTVWGYLGWSAATGTNQLRIGALPYPIKGDVNYYGTLLIGYAVGITLTGVQLTGFAAYGGTDIVIGQIMSGAAFANLAVPASGEIMFSMTYETDK